MPEMPDPTKGGITPPPPLVGDQQIAPVQPEEEKPTEDK